MSVKDNIDNIAGSIINIVNQIKDIDNSVEHQVDINSRIAVDMNEISNLASETHYYLNKPP
jgi:methyl-accepting chemotaxis protein